MVEEHITSNKINGHYIDLTSDQFDLYDIPLEYVPNEVVPREYCGMNADTNMRYQLLVRNSCMPSPAQLEVWIFFFNPHSCFQPIHPLHIDVQK